MERPLLNVVMIRRSRYSGLPEFEAYLKSAANGCPPNKPHLFLFPETPFAHSQVFPRRQVKAVVSRLKTFLAENHPLSSAAFSVNELAAGRQSNTGYLVSAGAHQALPKLELAPSDKASITQTGTTPGARFDASRMTEHWNIRSAVLQKKHGGLFPSRRFASGHNVQYRVCMDAEIRGATDNADVAVVSALGFAPPDYFSSVANTVPVTIVNDALFGPSALINGLPRQHFKLQDSCIEANQALSKYRVRVSVI